jgi:hypothetical protein
MMRHSGRGRTVLLGLAAVAIGATACSAAARPTAAGSSPSYPAAASAAGGGEPAHRPFLLRFHTVGQVAVTVPPNGDVNPYGVAVVRQTAGRLVRGDILVSNFNSKANVQGRGTTIVEVSPDGAMRPFAQLGSIESHGVNGAHRAHFARGGGGVLPASDNCPGGVGLTTGLAVLPGGWVVVGSLPTTARGAIPAVNPTGCLIVLDSRGTPVQTWVSRDINGPWDMTARAARGHAALFVSNVLSRPAGARTVPPQAGLCTVVRLDIALVPGARPRMTTATIVGTGFPWQQNKAALVQGPTGLALGSGGTLYVASTIGNSISAIPDAMTRNSAVTATSRVLTSGGSLNGPLGLTLVPGGDLIAVNGNDGKAVEITPAGRQVAAVTLVPRGAGDLFGVTTVADGRGLLFVNDGTNALDLFSG